MGQEWLSGILLDLVTTVFFKAVFVCVVEGPLLDGASLYQLLEEERCTLSAAVPTVFMGLLQYLRDTKQRLTHLETITIGGAACPALLIQAFQEEYGVEMRHMWGESYIYVTH